MRGPIDYIVVGFDNAKFDGTVIKTLEDAVQKGIIAVLDLAVISKDTKGMITEFNYENLGDDAVSVFMNKYKPTTDPKAKLDKADVQEVAELLEKGTAAGVLVIEHLWAKPFKKALLEKNAYLVAEGRIHPEAAAELDKGE